MHDFRNTCQRTGCNRGRRSYQARASYHHAQGAHVGVAGARGISTSAPITTWAWHSTRSKCRSRAGPARLGLWYGLGALYLRHPDLAQATRAENQPFWAPRTPYSTPPALMPTAACSKPFWMHEDAVISDELNHASIIDGVRLCKASRYRYRNNDMADLEAQLKAADAAGARFKLITTDGVFSMDGYIARLDEICDLAERYDALVHFDDCHATGFIGAAARAPTNCVAAWIGWISLPALWAKPWAVPVAVIPARDRK